tara:strand:- start:128 stop:319 length:192 start_codon:yes stop_codon:yes gene_type:complete
MEPLSREFLLKRGYCCGNGCKNCPYTENEMAKLIWKLYNEKRITLEVAIELLSQYDRSKERNR